ncbi:MAG: hypothetical protein JW924_12010 [Fusobacteriaceae bacterium]|nr:hypothetical protein [Fusobacteriaceae bacterium]
MQKTEGMILTNLGNQMISQALSQGLALIFTKISIGDGELGVLENPKELSNLKKNFKDIQISSIDSETVGEVRIRGAFTNKGFTQTFHWGEIGIFAKVGNEGTEKLYSYCNFGLDTEPIIMDDGTNIVERVIDTYNIIKDTANYTAVINSSIFATINDLKDSFNSVLTKITESFISPFLKGAPTATTPELGDNSARIPTTSWVRNAMGNIMETLGFVYNTNAGTNKGGYIQFPSCFKNFKIQWSLLYTDTSGFVTWTFPISFSYGGLVSGTNYSGGYTNIMTTPSNTLTSAQLKANGQYSIMAIAVGF